MFLPFKDGIGVGRGSGRENIHKFYYDMHFCPVQERFQGASEENQTGGSILLPVGQVNGLAGEGVMAVRQELDAPVRHEGVAPVLRRIGIAMQGGGERRPLKGTVPVPPVATRTLNLERVPITATGAVEQQQPATAWATVVVAQLVQFRWHGTTLAGPRQPQAPACP